MDSGQARTTRIDKKWKEIFHGPSVLCTHRTQNRTACISPRDRPRCGIRDGASDPSLRRRGPHERGFLANGDTRRLFNVLQHREVSFCPLPLPPPHSLSLSLFLSLSLSLALFGVIIINARLGPAWKSERTDIWAVPVYNI